MANQKILSSEIKNRKEWLFRQGHMTLNFTIDVEVKTDLKDFLQCLKSACVAVETELKNNI